MDLRKIKMFSEILFISMEKFPGKSAARIYGIWEYFGEFIGKVPWQKFRFYMLKTHYFFAFGD